MPRAYSDDLRARVVRAVDSGRSRRSVAKAFEVSVSFVIKLMLHRKAYGSHKPRKIGGYNKALLSKHRATVEALVAEVPDITLEQMRAKLAEQKIEVSIWSIHRFLKALHYSVKKNDICQGTGSSRRCRTAD